MRGDLERAPAKELIDAIREHAKAINKLAEAHDGKTSVGSGIAWGCFFLALASCEVAEKFVP